MSAHYISINRGKGAVSLDSDLTFGTSSASGDDLEVRIEDAPGWTRFEVIKALKAIVRTLEERHTQTDFPPL